MGKKPEDKKPADKEIEKPEAKVSVEENDLHASAMIDHQDSHPKFAKFKKGAK